MDFLATSKGSVLELGTVVEPQNMPPIEGVDMLARLGVLCRKSQAPIDNRHFSMKQQKGEASNLLNGIFIDAWAIF